MGGASLRDLVARLIEDGKAYATAETAVVKATIRAWIKPAKVAVPLVLIAVFLVQAALVVLIAGIGMLLARWIGVPGGLLGAAVIAIALSGGLVWIAVAKLSKGGQ